jgi:predicted GNAT family N-acyltransferase
LPIESCGSTPTNSLSTVNAEIVELRAQDTHALRRTILRDGTASDVVEFDGDDLPSTFHLGVSAEGRIVAVSTWLVADHPDHPNRNGVQLRGMATAPDHRGTGISAALLAAGIDRCAASGFELVWARARVTALSFYVRHGFTPIGDEYVDSTTGLRHRDILQNID